MKKTINPATAIIVAQTGTDQAITLEPSRGGKGIILNKASQALIKKP